MRSPLKITFQRCPDINYIQDPCNIKGRKCGFDSKTSDVKFIHKRNEERNAGSLQSGMTQKAQSSRIKPKQRSQWHKTREGSALQQIPRRLYREHQEGADQRSAPLFHQRYRSVCHFFKEVSQDQSCR